MSRSDFSPVRDAVLSPSKEGGPGDSSLHCYPHTAGTARGQQGTTQKLPILSCPLGLGQVGQLAVLLGQRKKSPVPRPRGQLKMAEKQPKKSSHSASPCFTRKRLGLLTPYQTARAGHMGGIALPPASCPTFVPLEHRDTWGKNRRVAYIFNYLAQREPTHT